MPLEGVAERQERQRHVFLVHVERVGARHHVRHQGARA